MPARRFGIRRKVIPPQTEVQSEIRRQLPVVLKERADIPSVVVGRRDVATRECAKTARIIHPTRNGRSGWHKQEIAETGKAGVGVWNIRVLAAEGHVAAALRRLRDVAFNTDHLDPGLEDVVAVDLGHAVGTLDAVDVLQRRRVIPNSNVSQAVDCNRWKTADYWRPAECPECQTAREFPSCLPKTERCSLSECIMPTCISFVRVGVKMWVYPTANAQAGKLSLRPPV